jgi:hypothetical protein
MSDESSVEIEQITENFAISNHKFINLLSDGIINIISKDIKGLDLKMVDKSESHRMISTSLIGQIVIDENNKDDIGQRVENIMQRLQNPSNLLSLLKG